MTLFTPPSGVTRSEEWQKHWSRSFRCIFWRYSDWLVKSNHFPWRAVLLDWIYPIFIFLSLIRLFKMFSKNNFVSYNIHYSCIYMLQIVTYKCINKKYSRYLYWFLVVVKMFFIYLLLTLNLSHATPMFENS